MDLWAFMGRGERIHRFTLVLIGNAGCLGLIRNQDTLDSMSVSNFLHVFRVTAGKVSIYCCS